jgi:hypothetical protein
MSKACGQHAGLAGPRAGEDEKRAIHRLDSFPLFGIQARKVVGHGQGIGRGTASDQTANPRIIPPRAA